MSDPRRDWIRRMGRRYWPKAADMVAALPIAPSQRPFADRLITVALPPFAAQWGIGEPSALLVDQSCLADGDGPAHLRCDWWGAAFHHLNATSQREQERVHGPIHSYSHGLKDWDCRAAERAWVNRIFLFLRHWAAHAAEVEAEALFGPLPQARIDLSHDVDYVAKTTALRLKQAALQSFNALRLAKDGRGGDSLRTLGRGLHFAVTPADYWCFPAIRALETAANRRSVFHFYGGEGPKSPRDWLFDPAYDVKAPRLAAEIASLAENGWEIGLHQSFAAWADAASMARQRQRIEAVTGRPVTRCRQHWLRFSWEWTWAAQDAAGLRLDTTLCFNDRPGFRNGAALSFHPWDDARGEELALAALPTVLMDSHLWDYALLAEDQRWTVARHWLDEVFFVHGEASVIWHQRVMHPDYGWGGLYAQVVDRAVGGAP